MARRKPGEAGACQRQTGNVIFKETEETAMKKRILASLLALCLLVSLLPTTALAAETEPEIQSPEAAEEVLETVPESGDFSETLPETDALPPEEISGDEEQKEEAPALPLPLETEPVNMPAITDEAQLENPEPTENAPEDADMPAVLDVAEEPDGPAAAEEPDTPAVLDEEPNDENEEQNVSDGQAAAVPEKPTAEQIKNSGLGGVDMFCGKTDGYTGNHWIGYYASYNIGDVLPNEDGDQDAYPYKCEVRSGFSFESLLSTFLGRGGGNAGHVRDTDRGAADPAATLYYNASTQGWEILTGNGRNQTLRQEGGKYYMTFWVNRYATCVYRDADGAEQTAQVSLCKMDTSQNLPADLPMTSGYTVGDETYTFDGWKETSDENGAVIYTAQYQKDAVWPEPTLEEVAWGLKIRFEDLNNGSHDTIITLGEGDYALGPVEETGRTSYPYSCRLTLTGTVADWVERFNDTYFPGEPHWLSGSSKEEGEYLGATFYYRASENRWVIPGYQDPPKDMSNPGVSIQTNGNFFVFFVIREKPYEWRDHEGNVVYERGMSLCASNPTPPKFYGTNPLGYLAEDGSLMRFSHWAAAVEKDGIMVHEAVYVRMELGGQITENADGSLTIPGGTALDNVTIPKAVTSVTVPGKEALLKLRAERETLTLPEGSSVLLPDGTVTEAQVLYYYTSGNVYGILEPASGLFVLSGNGAMWSASSSKNVPWVYSGNSRESIRTVKIMAGVTGLSNYAFDGCVNLEEIHFPDGLNQIGTYAFRECTSLESIVLPEGITELSGGMFRDCENLKSVGIPTTVTKIGQSAFYGAGLTQIEIPAGVTELGSSAFERSENLETVILPAGIRLTGANVFLSCASLRNLVFRGAPEAVYSSAFGTTYGYPNDLIVYVNERDEATEQLITALNNSQRCTYNIAVLEGGAIAQYSVDGLSEPEKEGYIFEGWTDENGLAVTEAAGDKAVYTAQYKKAESVWQEPTAEEVTKALKVRFEDKNNSSHNQELALGEGDFTLGAVEETGNASYPYSCRMTLTGTVGEWVERYNTACAPQEAHWLWEGNLKEDQYLGATFYYRESEGRWVIPSYQTPPNDMPNPVVSIQTNGNFFVIYVMRETSYEWRDYEGNVVYKRGMDLCASKPTPPKFGGTNPLGYLAGDGSLMRFSHWTAAVEKDGVMVHDAVYVRMELGGQVTENADGSLTIPGGTVLDNVTIPKGVASVTVPGKEAVLKLRAEKETLTLPEGSSTLLPDGTVTEEQLLYYFSSGNVYGALDPASGLLIVSGSGSMNANGKSPWASNGNSKGKIRTVKVMDGVTGLVDSAFNNCTNLAEIHFLGEMERIGNNAFEGCAALESIVLPEGITEIGTAMFRDCAALTSVKIPSSVSTIGSNAFCRSGLTMAEIPSGVKTIGMWAFESNEALKTVILPAGVRLDGANIFLNCDNLSSLVFRGAPEGVYASAFGTTYGCPEDLVVYVNEKDEATAELITALNNAKKCRYNIAVLNGGAIAQYSVDGLSEPEREGYRFEGWTDENGRLVTEAAGDKAVYTAQWERKSYTVTIDSVAVTVKHGDKLPLPEAPEREGYVLIGWVDGEGNTVTAETIVTGDMSVTAQWERKTYTITIDSVVTVVKHGDTIPLPEDPQREGYEFIGWIDGNGNAVTADTVATGDMTVTAQWKEVTPPVVDPEPGEPTPPVDPGEPDPEPPVDPTDPEPPVDPVDPEPPVNPTDPEPPVNPPAPGNPTPPQGGTATPPTNQPPADTTQTEDEEATTPTASRPLTPAPTREETEEAEEIEEQNVPLAAPEDETEEQREEPETEPETAAEEESKPAAPTEEWEEEEIPLAVGRDAGTKLSVWSYIMAIAAAGFGLFWLIFILRRRKEDEK